MNEHLKVTGGKLFYYNTPIAFVDEYNKILVADSIFKTKDLDKYLQNNWNVRWVDNIFEQLTNENVEKAPPIKSVRIWFLTDEIDSQYKFIPYHQFRAIGGASLSLEDYHCVFDSPFQTNSLDDIFAAFQLGKADHYTKRKLAMGDVIELYDHIDRHFYYIDKVGFKEITSPMLFHGRKTNYNKSSLKKERI